MSICIKRTCVNCEHHRYEDFDSSPHIVCESIQVKSRIDNEQEAGGLSKLWWRDVCNHPNVRFIYDNVTGETHERLVVGQVCCWASSLRNCKYLRKEENLCGYSGNWFNPKAHAQTTMSDQVGILRAEVTALKAANSALRLELHRQEADREGE